jgi:hypothetical protein
LVFEVALAMEGDDRFAYISGKQEDVVEAAAPRLAKQRLEKRRPADLEEGSASWAFRRGGFRIRL